MTAGNEAEAVAGIADRLCAEFGYPVGEGAPPRSSATGDDPLRRLFGEKLSREQEQLILTARRNLERLAAALGDKHPKMVSETTFGALLDGAESALRSELASGTSIAEVMPSLVFLIALPMVTHEEALELSRRTAVLLRDEQDPDPGTT